MWRVSVFGLLGLLASPAVVGAAPAPWPGCADAARADEPLPANQAAERRAAAELAVLRARQAPTDAQAGAYNTCLRQPRAQLAPGHAPVEWMQLAQSGSPPRAAPAVAPSSRPVRTEAEEMSTLDAELRGSLADFDDMLLREQEALRQRAAGTQGGSGSSSTASRSQAGSAGGEGQQRAGSRGPPGPASWKDADNTDAASSSRPASEVATVGGTQGTGPTRAPGQLPDDRDDDVVARQLREAAEKETDPELRARLWEEYRKYKQGSN